MKMHYGNYQKGVAPGRKRVTLSESGFALSR